MIFIANALVAVVAALHVFFLVLEMFLWDKPLGLKVFRNTIEKATDSKVLAANQGLYNGFLAAGVLWGLAEGHTSYGMRVRLFFGACIVLAGVYGAWSTGKRTILVLQALLPAQMTAERIKRHRASRTTTRLWRAPPCF